MERTSSQNTPGSFKSENEIAIPLSNDQLYKPTELGTQPNSSESPTKPTTPQTQEDDVAASIIESLIDKELPKASGSPEDEQKRDQERTERKKELQGKTLGELNEAAIEYVKRTMGADYKTVGANDQDQEEHSVEELGRNNIALGKEILELHNQQSEILYGKDGVFTTTFSKMLQNPAEYGLDPAIFASKDGKNPTIGSVLEGIYNSQVEHQTNEARKELGLKVDEKLTPEQQEQIDAKVSGLKADFDKQKNTLVERAKACGIDLIVAGWDGSDFAEVFKSIFAFDGYSRGNSTFFREAPQGKKSVGATDLKQMIGWESGLSTTDAQEKWMFLFEHIAKELQKKSLGHFSKPLDEWRSHKNQNEINADMKELYEAIVVSGAPQQIANEVFKKGFESAKSDSGSNNNITFRETFDDSHYVNNDLITCIEMLGSSGSFYKNFFGDLSGRT